VTRVHQDLARGPHARPKTSRPPPGPGAAATHTAPTASPPPPRLTSSAAGRSAVSTTGRRQMGQAAGRPPHMCAQQSSHFWMQSSQNSCPHGVATGCRKTWALGGARLGGGGMRACVGVGAHACEPSRALLEEARAARDNRRISADAPWQRWEARTW
jgi:hypothetical protein